MKKSFKVGIVSGLLACIVSFQSMAEESAYYAVIECRYPNGSLFKKIVKNVNLKFAPVIHYTDMDGYEHDTTYSCDVQYLKKGEKPKGSN